MPEFGQLAMEAMAARPRLVAEMEPPSVAAQLLGRPADVIGPVLDRAPVPDLAPAFSLRYSHRDRRLVDIQPDERAVLHAVSPSFSRLGTRPARLAQPSKENAAEEATDPVRSHRDHGVYAAVAN
ncbi:hypothetical protein LV780_17130 [Cereibacter azotoformans]|uniref:hypothetical protein n=1 Tax=Cereibacter azotoformans TaxID=43057 RepID=UPI00195FFD95|nr:hypothetical protein [Cereibacter azotoformans]UIJ32834.1 hypothetical protein LV780_17130 [Cereibacter azotoformans]